MMAAASTTALRQAAAPQQQQQQQQRRRRALRAALCASAAFPAPARAPSPSACDWRQLQMAVRCVPSQREGVKGWVAARA